MTQQEDNDTTVDAHLKNWLEAEFGGSIVRFEKVRRWRPAWLVDIARDQGEVVALYVRGDRPIGFEPERLEREFGALKLLNEYGIPAPKVYGWCPRPRAIVMARVDGKPFEGGADTDPHLRSAVKEYITHLAAVHAIPVEKAEAFGARRPHTAEEMAFHDYRRGETIYLAHKKGPNALAEFARLWLQRNAPLHRSECCMLVGDGPQFIHRGGKIQALIDLELAQIGDPMLDLAGLRRRDVMEPSGGMRELLELYADHSGKPIDPVALSFYTVALHIYTDMYARPQLAVGGKHPGYVEYLSWCMSATCLTMEAIAEAEGAVLTPAPPVEPSESPYRYAMEALVAECEAQTGDTGFFHESPALSLARYVSRVDQLGKGIETAELTEAEKLLGEPSADLDEAEAKLEAMVISSGPERDIELAQFFFMRETRRIQLIADYPSRLATGKLDLVLPFAGKASSRTR